MRLRWGDRPSAVTVDRQRPDQGAYCQAAISQSSWPSPSLSSWPNCPSMPEVRCDLASIVHEGLQLPDLRSRRSRRDTPSFGN